MARQINRVSDAFTRLRLRIAREADVSGIEKLIALSVRGLQADYYSASQIEAALGSVFGVDRQLIRTELTTSSSSKANSLAVAVGASAKHFSAVTIKRTATMLS